MASKDGEIGLEPIAVVGIGCRFPGGITDLDSFWDVLVNKKDVVSPMPENRLGDPARIVDSQRNPGKVVTSSGGFLDNIEKFDAEFFNISPREAELLDPQHRVMLEITFEALEDAGIKLRNISGTKTGVYVGQWTSDYENRLKSTTTNYDLYSTTGTGRYANAGRISYAFNLQGPSMAIDTACSSSLVTIHLACQAIRNNEIEMGLAGGVNLLLDPFISIGYSRSKILSDYGRCRFGDDSGSGYVRSEGAGMVLLKKLSRAIEDGDHIHAVIRGGRVNSDGQSNKYLVAPSNITQEIMLRDAYASSGVDPSRIDYIEAHGTGTKAGDPTEFQALGAVLSEGREPNDKCIIGSVKTNIGHAEAASGVAGFIKAVLALKKRKIPASLHLKNPNTNINWKNSPFDLSQEMVDLSGKEYPLYAGVNSFGITGTNAHIILEEYQNHEEAAAWKKETAYFGLPVSANSTPSLESYLELYNDLMQTSKEASLANLVHNISIRKSDLNERRFLVFESDNSLKEVLQHISEKEADENMVGGVVDTAFPPKVAFVFPGQGSQWIGMGRELYETEAVFKEAILAIETEFNKHLQWSLTSKLLEENSEDLYNTQATLQPTLFAIEIALARLWQAWGIQPDAVVGHSMGEVAAAYIAGNLSIADASKIICTRSALMTTLSGSSGMGYIAMSPEEVEPLLQGKDLTISINNSPKSVVVGGEIKALDDLLANLDGQGVFCRKVKMDVASHSPQMDPLKDSLRDQLSDISASNGSIPFYSSVRHSALQGGDLNPDYWVSNLREPVQFAKTIQALIQDGITVFIEVSPHAVLTQAVRENAEFLESEIQTIGSLKRNTDDRKTFLLNIGNAYCSGLYPDWTKIYEGSFKKEKLPNYPWNRELYWVDESHETSSVGRVEIRHGKTAHPFLARRIDLPDDKGTWVWESDIDLVSFPYLADHLIDEAIVFPAAGYIEAMRAAIAEIFGPGDHLIENLEIKSALALHEKSRINFQLIIQQRIEDSYDLIIRSKAEGNESWTEHASAIVLSNYSRNLEPIKLTTLSNTITSEQHYQLTKNMRFPYGEAFQSIQGIKHNDDEWQAEIKISHTLDSQIHQYGIHPALLDGAIQLPLNISLKKVNGATYIPVRIDKLYFADALAEINEAQVLVQELTSSNDIISVNLQVMSGGKVLVFMEGLQLRLLESQTLGKELPEDNLYEIDWAEMEIDAEPTSQSRRNLILINAPSEWKDLDPVYRIDWGDLKVSEGSATLSPGDEAHWKAAIQDGVKAIDNPVILLNISTPYEAFSEEQFYQDDINLNALTGLAKALAADEIKASVWLITNGSQAWQNDKIHLQQTPVWGMCNVILNEHPELNIHRLDLSTSPSSIEWETAAKLIEVHTSENEIVIRGDKTFAARLIPYEIQDQKSESKTEKSNGRPFAVKQHEPGIIDNLSIEEIVRRQPGPDEVEIEVKALGINFMNLMSVLGIYPGKENGFGTLGIECAGIVTGKGNNVFNLEVGDEVLGMCYDSMASHVIVKSSLLRKKPAVMSFVEAATIPVVFLTSYYALVHLGRLKKGERLLIHSATGGVGLSTIQIAQEIGAEIYATAGTEEKRELLRSLGVKHVYHSRNLDFADQIMKDTNGEGIDVVLNSLTGEAMLRSMQLLRSFGRFLEIGKKDVYNNSEIGLEVFSRGLSYSMIDLEKMVFEAPEELGKLMEEVLPYFERGAYKALPNKVFGVSQVKEAFTFMSKAQHIGKIIISLEGDEPEISLLDGSKTAFDPEASYLLTGGYGGLGLTYANWMADRGARNIVLAGRSGPNSNAKQIIEELKSKGVNVIVEQADVSVRADVKRILSNIPNDRPLRGVMHLAGFLDDAALRNMTRQQYHNVLKPKVSGAWNLHEETQSLELDFFVLFASSALLFGSPGQSAYVAANAFLDALSHYRRSQGLPSLSVDWGTISEVGLAIKDANQADRLAEEGIATLSPKECTDLYELIADSETPSIGAFKFDLKKWEQAYPSAGKNPFYEMLRSDVVVSNAGETSFAGELKSKSPDDARDAVEMKLKELVGGVIKKSGDTIKNSMAFKTLGIDSLMAIQLKNRLEQAFELPISVTSFWTYSTIRDYIKYLLSNLDLESTEENNSQPEASDAKTEEVATEPEIASDDDISDLLAAELKDLS